MGIFHTSLPAQHGSTRCKSSTCLDRLWGKLYIHRPAMRPWLLQMTGLNLEKDVIIEIFCIITNGNLDVLDEEGWGAVIHQSKERMDQMVIHLPFMIINTILRRSCWHPGSWFRTNGVPRPTARMVWRQQSSLQRPQLNKPRPIYLRISRNTFLIERERCWQATRSMQTRLFCGKSPTTRFIAIWAIVY